MTDDPRSRQPVFDVEPVTLTTSDGEQLAGEVALPADRADAGPSCGVVVCHPHPLYGGSMHANVVEALFRALPADAAAVLRFDFRGVGASTGTHDEGRAEQLDVAAAIDAFVERWPGVPVLLAGYSFGADVALTVDDPSLSGWFAVAPPLRIVDRAEMVALTDPRPTTIATGVHDQFNPASAAAATVADAPSTTVVPIDGADHFFAVGLDAIVTAARHALTMA